MKRLMLGLGAVLSGIAWAEATVTTEGTELTINVPNGETYTYAEAVSGLTKIVKTGGGACAFAPASVSFTGAVDVQAGTLHGDRTKFGTPASWKVANGASLRFDTAADYAGGENQNPPGSLEIGGLGCNGDAAYSFPMLPTSKYSTSHRHFAAGVKLTGDTSVSGGRFGFGPLDMQGHSLYTYCTNGQAQFEIFANIANAGDVYVKKGQLLVQDAMKFTTPLTGQAYVLANDSKVAMWNTTYNPTSYQAPLMDIKLEKNAYGTLACNGGDYSMDATKNTWLGNWHLENGIRLTVNVGDIRHRGSLRGSVYGGEVYKNGNGTYDFTTNGVHRMKNLYVAAGTVNLEGNADESPYMITNIWLVTGTEYGAGAPRLRLRKTVRTDFDPKSITDNACIRLGISSKNYRHMGIVEIEDGAVVSNNFLVGWDASGGWHKGGMGAVYMNDATVYWKAGGGSDGFIGCGDWGYGYWCQNAGTFSHRGYMNLGATGHGCIDQRGGLHRIETSDPLKLARTGNMSWGCYHQTGGTFEGKNAWFNYNYRKDNQNAISILTTTGPNSLFSCDTMTVDMSTNQVDTFVNVNDGAALKGRLFRDIRYDGYNKANWATEAPTMTNTTHLYVNLNGGVLKTAGGSDLWGSDRMHGPTRATVYEKGVTFDTTDGDIVLNTELVKPFGKGLKSITIPTGVAGADKYVGSPRIKITSSTGSGASAYAVFDEKTRTITRIDITSPGCGYEDATIRIDERLLTENGEIAATTFQLEVQSTTGGVRKVGSGTLTLAGANTYGGVTRVEGGSIAFTHANGLPQGSALEFAAAAVAGGAKETPLLSAVNYTGGEIRITEAETLDAETFGRSRVLATFANVPATTPTVRLIRSDGTELAGSDWKVFLSSEGKLRFGRNIGLTLLVR